MQTYIMHDRAEQLRCDENCAQIAIEKMESDLADFYESELKYHHLAAMIRNTHADHAAINSLMDDVDYQDLASEFMRITAEMLAKKQCEYEYSVRE
ncbi:host-nuclease inhibitor Gam family protein [Entomohabitans teleogrylli]|uniref:host-nuclease inhibitor Gam family protein n=1 Tax=Entomohabitans teleogrylli TaxID=1384589 RepID=UPI00073DB1A7|nr:host-nuclease inhibitor Gam family protein [Entomohabitans teleogrylli]